MDDPHSEQPVPDDADVTTDAAELPSALQPPERGTTEVPVAHDRNARLVLLAGGPLGTSYNLSAELTIGRAAEAGIRLSTAGISRLHARITRDPRRGFVVQDLGSRNGTFLNGSPIGKTATPLSFGDRIQLASDVAFLFTRTDAAEDHVAHLRRMEMVGRLAASVAHDFNNLLSVMVAGLEHLESLNLDDALPDSEAEASVADALTASRDAVVLSKRLLALARPVSDRLRPVSIAEAVDEVVRMCRRMFPSSVRFAVDSENEDFNVTAEPTEVGQILMNLCVNARDAMPDGGTIEVRTFRMRPNHDTPPVPLRGDHVVLLVRDSGMGMDDAVRDRIFDPFFTTKGDQGGSGLGLATVDAAVRRYRGHITVESEPGRGTTFRVFLPIVKPDATSTHRVFQRRKTSSIPAKMRTLSILAVASDPIALRTMDRMVRRAGHAVTTTSDLDQVTELIDAEHYSLLLVDETVLGPGAFERLGTLSDHLPVVLYANGLPDDIQEDALRSRVSAFVAKPSSSSELDDVLRSVVILG